MVRGSGRGSKRYVTFRELWEQGKRSGNPYFEAITRPEELFGGVEQPPEPVVTVSRPREEGTSRRLKTVAVLPETLYGLRLLAFLRGTTVYRVVDLAVRCYVRQHRDELAVLFASLREREGI